MPPPTRIPPARPAPRPSTNGVATAPRRTVTFGEISTAGGQRIVLYGPGGIGKTTLAAMAPGPVAFFDLDDSLPRLKKSLDESGHNLQLRPVPDLHTWQDVRETLHAEGWEGVRTIVIDTATRLEEMCVNYVLENVPHPDKHHLVDRIEQYGYGKGYTFVYDEWIKLLGDLDQHARAGRNVILVCHDCTNEVPNPTGEDWLRYEPRLQSPSSGKSSIRLRVKEWADHMLFIGYDVSVSDDGKGKGCGSRCLYPIELPHCMAKSRSLADQIPLGKFDLTLWETLFPQ